MKGERDGKWVTYRGYEYNFVCKKESLRVAANPMDALMAFQEL